VVGPRDPGAHPMGMAASHPHPDGPPASDIAGRDRHTHACHANPFTHTRLPTGRTATLTS